MDAQPNGKNTTKMVVNSRHEAGASRLQKGLARGGTRYKRAPAGKFKVPYDERYIFKPVDY